MVENLPANAGHTGSCPGLGRSHMLRSNWAREPQLLSLRVWSLCPATRGHDSERPAHCDEEWPPLATTRESPRTETKTQHSQKERKKERKKYRFVSHSPGGWEAQDQGPGIFGVWSEPTSWLIDSHLLCVLSWQKGQGRSLGFLV